MKFAIEKNLKRGMQLLNTISDEQYSNCEIPPYYSSIGKNIRHILDVFNCIFDGLESGMIDLSKRQRNPLAEEKIAFGLIYFTEIIEKVRTLKTEDFDKIVKVTDDLGTGKRVIKYTLEGILSQANSHVIHHFANIGFIAYQLGIELPNADFGYNPTTKPAQRY